MAHTMSFSHPTKALKNLSRNVVFWFKTCSRWLIPGGAIVILICLITIWRYFPCEPDAVIPATSRDHWYWVKRGLLADHLNLFAHMLRGSHTLELVNVKTRESHLRIDLL